ncbi:exoribonuclease R [Halopolyspora algeriensis]|uniref:Exoribonuclease R n=1 Tax=Halopolyspora algeriensis TaxID=1500506 RepID=A0A368VHF6_9ACTN|nr:RNB domain-containing ribonuclease [Halopolyspora algeriensis]RCW40688.1 exoribonuclease R [Halopolyspora algeriensis]TQM53389.1 exoribonuclease R [Halopolyspora algeriensis]
MAATRVAHGGGDASAVPAGTAAAGNPDFSAIRAELGLPVEYPSAALSEVEQTAAQPVLDVARVDATDLPMVTVDPAGAKDLDQALLIDRRGRRGYRVHYAIADVAAFVPPGGALDAEVRSRGQTLYLPDGNVPLHPTLLSEGAASLLPEQRRPAVLWTIDLDRDGTAVGVDVRRAVVRSVARLDYEGVQQSLELGAAPPAVALLPEVGRLRREQAVHRGAIELGPPEQQVESDGAGGWRLTLRPRLPLEAFNAEISLLTGMCAAQIMLSGGIGVLRTVPDPEDRTIAALRRSALELGLEWPDRQTPAEFLSGLDPARPEALALHVSATRLLRGAGYTVFDGGVPDKVRHAGIGAAYAHVTAPLRRLADRYGTEICLAVHAGREVPEWVRAALPQLPSAMGSSDRAAGQVERACIAQAQAWALAGRIGDEFTATVLRSGSAGESGEVFVPAPPVIARCCGDHLSEGQRVRVRLTEADPVQRDVAFEVVAPTPV